MHYRNRVIEFEMERNLTKWEGNNKMFKKLQKSVKAKFKLKTQFSIYDPKDDMFVDDIDDLCGCYIGYELDYGFILSLHIKVFSLCTVHTLYYIQTHTIRHPMSLWM